MKKSRKLLFVLTSFAALLLMAVPTFAQDAVQTTRTVTITEQQINDLWRIANSPRYRVEDKSVDLQPGQVVVTTTFIFPRVGITAEVITTIVPTVENGRIFWEATSIAANGDEVSEELLNQANAAVASSWRNYVKGQLSGRVIDLTITDTDATVTLGARR